MKRIQQNYNSTSKLGCIYILYIYIFCHSIHFQHSWCIQSNKEKNRCALNSVNFTLEEYKIILIISFFEEIMNLNEEQELTILFSSSIIHEQYQRNKNCWWIRKVNNGDPPKCDNCQLSHVRFLLFILLCDMNCVFNNKYWHSLLAMEFVTINTTFTWCNITKVIYIYIFIP